MARWQSCNVLQVGKDGRQIWQFAPSADKCPLQKSEFKLPTEPLPQKLIAKDWQDLVKPKLNIALLPPEQVFLRAVQLPKADVAESQSMIELQLEKLSPLPVAQLVWGFELLPQPFGDMQTAVVIIVARSVVEEFLGRIEGQGFLADRLELPLVDQLRVTQVNEDGVWIYPGIGADKDHCLVAWWYAGVLCHVSLMVLPAPERRTAALKEHLTQTIWAGELEGWLISPPSYHLVADTSAAEQWLLNFIQDESVEVIPAASVQELAALTARRTAANGATTNLLPPEYSTRYRQRFVDRLWMNGLGGVVAVYLLVIAAYFGWVQYAQYHLDGINEEAVGLSNTYTNTLRIKEHVKVLQDQIDLQYAALDCWKAVADYLPPELQLDSLNFDRGRKVTLSGTATGEDVAKVQSFNESMRLAQVKNQALFSKVTPPTINPRQGGQISWVFPCDFKRTDLE